MCYYSHYSTCSLERRRLPAHRGKPDPFMKHWRGKKFSDVNLGTRVVHERKRQIHFYILSQKTRPYCQLPLQRAALAHTKTQTTWISIINLACEVSADSIWVESQLWQFYWAESVLFAQGLRYEEQPCSCKQKIQLKIDRIPVVCECGRSGSAW